MCTSYSTNKKIIVRRQLRKPSPFVRPLVSSSYRHTFEDFANRLLMGWTTNIGHEITKGPQRHIQLDWPKMSLISRLPRPGTLEIMPPPPPPFFLVSWFLVGGAVAVDSQTDCPLIELMSKSLWNVPALMKLQSGSPEGGYPISGCCTLNYLSRGGCSSMDILFTNDVLFTDPN